jgi:hypothetical protein
VDTRIGKDMSLSPERKNKSVVLDFSGVTFIDKKDVRMMESIQDGRIEIINCSLLIDLLLCNLIINK